MRIDELLDRGRSLFPKFKGNDDQLRRYLEDTVADIHAFFRLELDQPQVVELYLIFLAAYGESAAHQFRFSLRGAAKLSQALEGLVQLGKKGMASNNSHILVLMHIGFLEFVELGRFVSFHDWLRRGLRSGTIAPPCPGDLNAFQAYLDQRNEEYLQQQGASRALRRALSEGLTKEQKSRLLMAYVFSPPFALGDSVIEHRHLHCAARPEKRPKYCLSSCKPPSSAEIETLIPQLAKNFYDMRSAFAHRATCTVFAHPDVTPASQGGSIYDVYFLPDGRIVEYEVEISNDDLLSIFRSCLISRIRHRKP